MKVLQGYQVTLREIQLTDLEMLRHWRNSDFVREQMVAKGIISQAQQLQWFEGLRNRRDQQHWVIVYKDEPIGSANIRVAEGHQVGAELTGVEAIEPGLYIGEQRYQGNVLAFAPSLLLNDFCFRTLGCQRLVAKVKTDNQAAMKYNHTMGYRLQQQSTDDEGTRWSQIELTEASYEKHCKALKAFFHRARQ